MIDLAIVPQALELYKTLESDDSKDVFALVSEVINSFQDGKLDVSNIVEAISSRTPAQLQALVLQAELILEHAKNISTTLAEKEEE